MKNERENIVFDENHRIIITPPDKNRLRMIKHYYRITITPAGNEELRLADKIKRELEEKGIYAMRDDKATSITIKWTVCITVEEAKEQSNGTN